MKLKRGGQQKEVILRVGLVATVSFLIAFSFSALYLAKFSSMAASISIRDITLYKNVDFWILLLYVLPFVLFMGIHLIIDSKKIYDFLYRWRFVLGICIILYGVLLNVNGSSIAYWQNYISTGDAHTILGEARAIRTDEWATFTPFTFAQSYGDNAYSWFNTIIRGADTDVFIVYGQPVKHVLSVLFRPFLTGFLVFGVSRGLAFYWWSRFVCLWLVTFELSMLITKNKKIPSALMAVLISFSPVLQWWFAINGLVEMLFFGSLAILMLHRYMQDSVFWHRLIYLFVMYCCAGGYIMTFYPAWMVPVAYAFLALAIWVLVSNLKRCKMKWYDYLSILGVLLLFAGSMLYIYMQSKETINLVLNTAYPGKRVELGGGDASGFFRSYGNLFFTFSQDGVPNNVCESAVFFDFFPLGILLGLYVMIKNKKSDLLLILFMFMEGILAIYIIFGMPELLAKLTLLSFSKSTRAMIGAGLINILILIRAISLYKEEISVKKIYSVAFIYMLFGGVGSLYAYGTTYLTDAYIIIIAIISFGATYFLLRTYTRPYCLIAMMLVLFLVTTAGVNPVQYGTAEVTESDVALSIQKVVNEEPNAKWVAEMGYPMSNYTIIQGAPTINSTNVYPMFEHWANLDMEKKYEHIYNRYAHIMIEIVNDSSLIEGERFSLVAADNMKVIMDIEELKEMEVKYIFTSRQLEGNGIDAEAITLRSDVNGYRIYEIK